jgi:hypothetical protein
VSDFVAKLTAEHPAFLEKLKNEEPPVSIVELIDSGSWLPIFEEYAKFDHAAPEVEFLLVARRFAGGPDEAGAMVIYENFISESASTQANIGSETRKKYDAIFGEPHDQTIAEKAKAQQDWNMADLFTEAFDDVANMARQIAYRFHGIAEGARSGQ